MHTDLDSDLRNLPKISTFRTRALLAGILIVASGCAMNETGQRTGTGAAIGALGGAVLGTSRESAAIGAAVGAAGGYLYDQHDKRETAQTSNTQLQQENQQLRQNAAQQDQAKMSQKSTEELRQENERLKLEAENQRLRQQTNAY